MDRLAIKVEQIKGKGRGLVATKDLKAGDIIFTEEPYSFCLSQLENKCDYCLSDKKNLLFCSTCRLQKYCDVLCQKAALDSHKAECKNLPKLVRMEFNMRPEMIVLFTRLLRKIQIEKKEVRRRARTDGFPQSINDLESLYEHWEEKHRVRCKKEHKELESFLGRKIEEKEFNHLASRVYTNSLVITGPLIDWLGPAIYLKASLINNSCDFNSVPVYFGKTVIIRAVGTIMKGEEITVAYTDILEPTFKRRHILREKYCFTCNCTRCENKELDAKMQSILCEKCECQVLRKNYKTFMKCSACEHVQSQKHTSAVLAIEAESESFLKIGAAKPIPNILSE
ncbi:histone-lysine N-methyltransferase SMYD3-like [Anneissia japonica]|uniref:histone-lysine N-methyltransferase SMYD3-like n=1 Tax=Anneissia japonica TaxID=1529436 RepID=UPI0014255086|nr:histone-lysine N-methyltransferase SMYD3-like [Anneissia japonica]